MSSGPSLTLFPFASGPSQRWTTFYRTCLAIIMKVPLAPFYLSLTLSPLVGSSRVLQVITHHDYVHERTVRPRTGCHR